MKQKYIKLFFISLLIAAFVLNSCTTSIIRETYTKASPQINDATKISYIRAHKKDGTVYVFDSWLLSLKGDTLKGYGRYLDVNREVISEGNYDVPMNEIVLIETNEFSNIKPISGLFVPLVPTVLITLYCITNPKACFGSCPTFYAYDGETDIIQSEGFSGSVTPSLESNDIDALWRYKGTSHDFYLKLTNEALETHVIKKADILAVKKPENGRIGATATGDFYEISNLCEPVSCKAPEGDCINLLKKFDGKERYSESDSSDLTEKEIIELTFDKDDNKENALVLAFRQTLMTTYLFYQTLAYMGRDAIDWLVRFENNENVRNKFISFDKIFGGIEVLVKDKKSNWVKAGELKEVGPIASDVQILKLPECETNQQIKIQLLMTKGYWRIDYASIAKLGKKVKPEIYKPSKILNKGIADGDALLNLSDYEKPLITYPGDEYYLYYDLPENSENYELFLESRGYYIEWMREDWLKEENPARLLQALFDNKNYLKTIAPEFKKVESQMEETFWRSRYVKK